MRAFQKIEKHVIQRTQAGSILVGIVKFLPLMKLCGRAGGSGARPALLQRGARRRRSARGGARRIAFSNSAIPFIVRDDRRGRGGRQTQNPLDFGQQNQIWSANRKP